MSDFSFTVDTRPMANTLDSVNSSVRNVTASVVAMESAVVIAQKRASEQICENVDNGFFILMKSQFDQKIAAVSSEMRSAMQLMETFKNEIDKLMLIMSDDYDRIKQRYMKTFTSLDRALETRVHELDKYAYSISRNYKMSQFKNSNEVIKAICCGDENLMVNIKETVSSVKSKCSKSMVSMAGDVEEQINYSDSVKSILKETQLAEAREEFVPVLFSETDSLLSQDATVKDVITSGEAKFSRDSKYLNQLKESSADFSWKEVKNESYEPVKNSFQEKVSKEIADERVAREMLRLFNSTRWAETEERE